MKAKDCLLDATITTVTGEEYIIPLYVSFDLLEGLFDKLEGIPEFIKVMPGETLKSYRISTLEYNHYIGSDCETEEVYEILASLGEFTLHTGKPANEVQPVNPLVITLRNKMVRELEIAYLTKVNISWLKSKILKEEIKNYLDTTKDNSQEVVKTIEIMEKVIRTASLPHTHPYFKVAGGFKNIHTILEKQVTPELLDILNKHNEDRGLSTERKRQEEEKQKEVNKLKAAHDRKRAECEKLVAEFVDILEKLEILTRSN